MAPTSSIWTPSGEHIRYASRILPSAISYLARRAVDNSSPPLASVFALIIRQGGNLSKRSTSFPQYDDVTDFAPSDTPYKIPLSRRQQGILVIPTTYSGLDDGPAPGAVAGITVGAIAGFILLLYLILGIFRFVGGGDRIVQEEIITTHRRKSRARSRSVSQAMSEIRMPTPPATRARASVRETRRQTRREAETVMVEEELNRPDDVVVVEEEDDIVEVIEEHSPERPPRRAGRKTGYRTVDPAEFGGGSGPRRKINRR